MIDTNIDETLLDDFQPGYTETFTVHLARKLGWTTELSGRAIRDALRFLAVSAVPPPGEESREARVLVSSPIVDEAVDAIMLDTPLLMWLERTLLGARMIHVPAYAHQADAAINEIRYEFTLAMMRAAGYELDEQIWPPRLHAGARPCNVGGGWDDCGVRAQR